MSTSATGSADQSGFSVVRMPLRRVGEDSPRDADRGPSPQGRIALSDLGYAAAREQSADRVGDDQARLAASVAAAPESDAELERLRKCLSALKEDIEALPRATQLPPIPGLPLLDARMAGSDPGALDPATRISPLSRRRPRKGLSAFRLFLIATAIAVPIGGYYGAAGFARLMDEFDAAMRPSIEAQRVALVHVGEIVRVPRAENIPSGGVERPIAASLHPTTNIESKPGENETSVPAAVQGEGGPRAGEPSVTTPVDETPSPGDTAIVLDPEDVKPLLDRGRQFFDAGDVAAARLLFNRAASAGDVAAVVAMGTTYDPAVLGSRGVHGILADPQKARGWYEKAAQSGSTEGLRLLKALESRPDALRQTAEQTDPDASLAINRDLGRATQRDLLTRRQPVQYYKPRH
jgi:hypothetical protein